ncbi:MAG: diacylglycerol kinase family protein [Planctomycetaceae bacterium]|nr:diacylglycerol kinase family protein [Planctomycetaceae bacterium]
MTEQQANQKDHRTAAGGSTLSTVANGENRAWLRRRADAFRWAFTGIGTLFRTQVHPWIHLTATALVILFGVFLEVSTTEWVQLAIVTGMVWTAEALNTALEFAVDLASPEYHDLARHSKDVSAAAVLFASLTAAICAALIFLPRL